MASRPTLVVVSGPLGAGKTTLAHRLAQAVGCPAICDGYQPGLGDLVRFVSTPA